MSDWPSQYDQVFSRLRDVTCQSAGRWLAYCPAHQDEQRRSLSIAIGAEGKLLLSCMLRPCGCSVDAILAALGIDWPALFPNGQEAEKRQPKQRGTFERIYDYRDEQGDFLFQVVRYKNPKGFSQRTLSPAFDKDKPAGEANKKYVYSLAGVRRVLYRLPELRQAIKENSDRWVFLVEGEKDVENLRALGITATCSPMGAGKWLAEYAEPLRGCNVAVIPDEDPVNPTTGLRPGLEHALHACRTLYGVAASVRLVRLPVDPDSKQDVSDFLATLASQSANARKAKLAELVRNTPDFVPAEAVGQSPAAVPAKAPGVARDTPAAPAGPPASFLELMRLQATKEPRSLEEAVGQLRRSFLYAEEPLISGEIDKESLAKSLSWLAATCAGIYERYCHGDKSDDPVTAPAAPS